MSEIESSFTVDKRMKQLYQFYKLLLSNKWDELILVTRRGFWLYKIFTFIYTDLEVPGQYIHSDRYLTKMLDDKCIKGKTIFLADDTLNGGYNLFRFFCILKKKGAGDVVPYVFGMSIEFPQNVNLEDIHKIFYDVFPERSQNAEMADQFWQNFLGKVACYQYMSQEAVSKLSLFETELFQQYLCPLVIDLPMLTAKKEGGNVLRDSFELSQMQFSMLCRNTEGWSYISNTYGDEEMEIGQAGMEGILNVPIQCNFFELSNEKLDPLFQTIVADMVVKCKYNRLDNGNYQVIFTPFTIVRSLEKECLKKIFIILFENLDYGKKLLKQVEVNKSDLFAWTAIFRMVVYAMSLYVGEKFRVHLLEAVQIESGYDWNIVKQNSDEDFMNAVSSLINDGRIDDVQMERIANVCCENAMKKTAWERKGKQEYSIRAAFETVLFMIQGKKAIDYDNVLKMSEIEKAITEKYFFTDEGQARQGVIKIVLIMLEVSAFSNYIYVNDENVERAFRSGENSSLLLTKAGRLCYSCAEILYVSAGRVKYDDLKQEFFDRILDYMRDQEYFEKEIEPDVFRKYARMFCMVPKNMIHGQIMGKRFLIMNPDEGMQKLRKYAMNLSEEMIKESL